MFLYIHDFLYCCNQNACAWWLQKTVACHGRVSVHVLVVEWQLLLLPGWLKDSIVFHWSLSI